MFINKYIEPISAFGSKWFPSIILNRKFLKNYTLTPSIVEVLWINPIRCDVVICLPVNNKHGWTVESIDLVNKNFLEKCSMLPVSIAAKTIVDHLIKLHSNN